MSPPHPVPASRSPMAQQAVLLGTGGGLALEGIRGYPEDTKAPPGRHLGKTAVAHQRVPPQGRTPPCILASRSAARVMRWELATELSRPSPASPPSLEARAPAWRVGPARAAQLPTGETDLPALTRHAGLSPPRLDAECLHFQVLTQENIPRIRCTKTQPQERAEHMRVSLACGARAGRGPGISRTQLSARSLQQPPPSPRPPPAQSTHPPPPPRLTSAPRIPEPNPAGIPGPTGSHSPAQERPEITLETERLRPLDLDDARVTGFF